MSRACASTGGRSPARGRRRVCAWVIAAAGLLALAAGGPALAQPKSKTITLAFDNIAATDAIMQFRWLADIPIVFAPPPDARVSLSMMEVPLDDALDALCAQIGYTRRTVGRTYVLTPAERKPLLPTAADLEDRFLHPERQGLDAARLLLALTREQTALLSGGETLSYADLSPAQQELLGGIYTRLVGAARAGRIPGAQMLADALASPPDTLALGIRGYVWSMERPAPTRFPYPLQEFIIQGPGAPELGEEPTQAPTEE